MGPGDQIEEDGVCGLGRGARWVQRFRRRDLQVSQEVGHGRGEVSAGRTPQPSLCISSQGGVDFPTGERGPQGGGPQTP